MQSQLIILNVFDKINLIVTLCMFCFVIVYVLFCACFVIVYVSICFGICKDVYIVVHVRIDCGI